MVPRRLLQKRLLSTTTTEQRSSKNSTTNQWCVKNVTKSNFSESLVQEVKNDIKHSDFIAVSCKKTGTFSAPWRRILPFVDTTETAYLKAKDGAERFQIFEFMVCPFSLQQPTSTSNAKLIAHPYNFHLFPRDEVKIGMPSSYSFSCQTSYLTSMAREGFDFNTCIYDGISYLSRVQESAAKHRLGNPISDIHRRKSSSTPSVADSLFMERIKSRLRHWRNACKDKSDDKDEALIRSLRKLIVGNEMYGSRPCISIDVCSERQVQLIIEVMSDLSDDLVPLIVPEKGGGPKSVRVVLTSSEADKNLLERELQDVDEKENKKVRGFREVIDVISASQKPIVTYNCLNEFPFIHSKFLGPLPSSMKEFMCSLRMVFPSIIDVNDLLKEIGPLKSARSIPAALSYLKRQFFVPLDVEVPHQDLGNEGKIAGKNALFTAYLFSKLSSLLKITPDTNQSMVDGQLPKSMNDSADIFSHRELIDEENLSTDSTTRKVNTKDLVFMWGFKTGISAGVLKSVLRGTHDVFAEDYDVRLVDKSCAIVSFWKPSSAETLLDVMGSGADGYDALRELMSEGLKASGYGAYKRVCESSGFWETDLADSLDKALAECTDDICNKYLLEEVSWSSDMIDFDEL